MATPREVGKVLVTSAGKVPSTAGGILRRLIDIAVDGLDPLPSARATAAKHLAKHGALEPAVESIITTHIAMASAQGFVTNLGGLVAMLVAAPANVTGLVTVEIRMVACIAHLRGYDIDDPRVRTAMIMCLLGEDELQRQINAGILPTIPLAVATAPVFDADLDQRVSERVLGDAFAGVGGKRVTSFLGRAIPFVGGGVGAVSDGIAAYQIGSCAKTYLVSRRAS